MINYNVTALPGAAQCVGHYGERMKTGVRRLSFPASALVSPQEMNSSERPICIVEMG